MSFFTGGIHPSFNKVQDSIEVAKIPRRVILPLSQHIGAPCEPLVKIGDTVKIGQKIAQSNKFISAPIHSSVSGIVTEISVKPHPVLNKCVAVVIESSGPLEWDNSVKKREDIDSLENVELVKIINNAGIVGLGGAAFPTHVKLSPPPGKRIDTVILNGAECEPYLSCDHRLMLEKTEEVLKGFLLIKKILKSRNAVIGTEQNKENSAAFFRNKITELGGKVGVQVLETKYPQGSEKMLIYAMTQRKVPAGGLPLDIGCLVINVQTAKAVYDAVYEGKPLIERVITIAGGVNKPKNILVKIGTPFKELIEECGGSKGQIGKIISGGPMMGISQYTDEVPVIKGTSGILVQLKNEINLENAGDCIRCSRCVDACPMNLMPNIITRLTKNDLIKQAQNFYPKDCFECGCCSYVCPSKIPLVHYIKLAKSSI
ncbi:MAG: electron transport complex subunit RsxC [Nanoarchaeota archaeon]